MLEPTDAREFYTLYSQARTETDPALKVYYYTEAANHWKPSVGEKPLLACYFERGTVYLTQLKKNEAAVRDFTKVIRNEPKAADALFSRATAYQKLLDFTKARKDITRYIALRPLSLKGYEFRALLLYNEAFVFRTFRHIPQTIQDLTLLIKENDASLIYYSYRGSCYTLIDQIEDAISDFSLVINDAGLGTSHLPYRAYCYTLTGNTGKALEDYNKYLKSLVQKEQGYFERGLFYYHTNQYEQAIHDFNQVIHLCNDNPYLLPLAYLFKGLSLFDQKQYANAKTNLEKASQLFPESSREELIKVYSGLSATYYKLNDTPSSSMMLNKATTLLSSASDISRKKQTLEDVLQTNYIFSYQYVNDFLVNIIKRLNK